MKIFKFVITIIFLSIFEVSYSQTSNEKFMISNIDSMYIKGDTIHCYLQNLSSDDIMVSVALEKKIDSEWIDIIEDVLDITNDGLYKRKMAMTIAPESQQTLSTAINDVVVKKINAGIFRFKFYIIECNKEKTKYFRHSTEFKIGRVESVK